MTQLKEVYEVFFTLITDDYYFEMQEDERNEDCRELLDISVSLFEFPKKPIQIEDVSNTFNRVLTREEIFILAYGMVQPWIQRQLTNIELLRQKVSGPDFRVSSQAAHMKALNTLMTTTMDEHRRLQILYSRREGVGGQSTFSNLISRQR